MLLRFTYTRTNTFAILKIFDNPACDRPEVGVVKISSTTLFNQL